MSALFELLFKYPLVVFEKGRLVLSSPLPGWALAVVAVGLMGVVGWAYAGARGRVSRRERLVLAALRTATFAVIVFVLARPTLHLPAAVEQENYVAVLIDDSRSMRIADGGDGARSEQVRRTLHAEDSELLRALREKYRVRLFRFAGAAERLGEVGEMSFAGGQSRLGRALEQARSQLAGVPLAGMVLVTDGADRGEEELNRSLLGLRAGSIPVFTVGVGRESFDRDIEVRRVTAPRAVLKGAALRVDVVVAHTGYRGETVQVVVEDEGRVVGSQTVELGADGVPVPVRVELAAAESGPRRFRFRVAPRQGELVQENNQQEAVIEVRDGPEKILYLEGEPRFEVKFLRRAIEDDPGLQLVVLQRTAEDKFLRLDVDSAAELASGFPRTREELFAYRGLILGSVEAGFFSREQLRLIADFVSERGGGLLMLGGRRAYAEGGYAGTPIADVLPVYLDSRPDTSFFAEVRVEPTRAGLAHAALQLDPDPGRARERWASLPALSTFNRVTRLKPGATALLAGSGDDAPDGQVALAWQRYGRGTAIALPVQDSWIWQMHADVPLEDQTHEIFWRQMLRWLVSESPERLTVTPSAETAALQQPMRIQAEMRDEGFRPVNDARLVARIEAPDGSQRELPMAWSALRDGEYQATFTPTLPGPHTVRVEGLQGGRTASSTLLLDAVEDDGEFYSAQMRAPLLRRIAEETGGRFYTMSALRGLPEDLRYSGQGITRVEQKELWDMPIVFLLLVTLVAAEWGLRRWRGLV